jgi:pimeloyl-ACP methyl ester carboxylesterase
VVDNRTVASCVLLHGAGSRPDFIRRAFGEAVLRGGMTLVAPDVRGMDMAGMQRVLASLAADAEVVGGVSLGAHATTLYASATRWRGVLYAVMPAWIGQPDAVAGLTRATACEVARTGATATLERIEAESGDDWVVRELRRVWSTTASADLARHLEVAAEQSAPTLDELAAVRATTEVVALAGDPTHPEAVARVWTRQIPGASLHILPRALPGPEALAGPLRALLDRSSGFR